MVAVPRREIYAELDTLTAARLGNLAHDVALAILVWRVLDRVLGVGARPQAESVMMFGRKDQPLKARVLDDPDQSVGVEVRRVEYRLGLVAIAPLTVCEGVDGKVYEGILLHAVPLQLPRRRHHAHRRRRLGGATPQHKHRRYGRKGNPFHVHHRSGLGLGLNLCFRLSFLLPSRRAARTVVRASFDPRSPTPPAIGPRRKKYDFCRRFSSCVRAT